MRRIIIVGILIAFILVFVTGILIVNEKYKNLDTSTESGDTSKDDSKPVPVLYKEYHTPIKDGIKGAQIGEVYSTNALKWEKVYYEDNRKVGQYYQISGMKNKDIQTEVNRKIKQSALDFGEKAYNYMKTNPVNDESQYDLINYYKFIDGEIYQRYDDKYKESQSWKAFFNQCVVSSFSNVISVATGCFEDNTYDSYVYSRRNDEYVNIDLNTGEDLGFECIFSEDADILTIVRNLFYVEVPIYDSYAYEEEYWRDENGEIEYYEGEAYTYETNQRYEEIDIERLDRVMKKFKYTQDVDFYFAPNSFGIRVDDLFVIGNYADYEGKIAIFNRYAGDNLFEDSRYAINGLSAYSNYYVDNTMKKMVSRMNNDGVIYSYVVYSELKGDNPEENDILQKALIKIDDLVREEVRDLKKIKNDDQIIYYKTGFKIGMPTTIIDRSYSNVDQSYIDAINNQIDSSKKFFHISSYGTYGYYRMTKSQYKAGMIDKIDRMEVLSAADWSKYSKEYDETFKSVETIEEEYAKYRGFSDVYYLRDSLYYKPYYKVEDSEKFNGPIYYLKYILKDGSDEGLARYIEAACEFEKARAQNRYWGDSEDIINGINSGNYGIMSYYIRFYYYSYHYGENEYTTFDFIDTNDDLNRAYPVHDYWGI